MVDYLVLKNVTLIDVSNSVTAFHLGKTSTAQDFRHGAEYNDYLMKKYLLNTENNITGNEGRYHPVVRFGSMDNAQYETRRGNSTGSDTGDDLVEVISRNMSSHVSL